MGGAAAAVPPKTYQPSMMEDGGYDSLTQGDSACLASPQYQLTWVALSSSTGFQAGTHSKKNEEDGDEPGGGHLVEQDANTYSALGRASTQTWSSQQQA